MSDGKDSALFVNTIISTVFKDVTFDYEKSVNALIAEIKENLSPKNNSFIEVIKDFNKKVKIENIFDYDSFSLKNLNSFAKVSDEFKRISCGTKMYFIIFLIFRNNLEKEKILLDEPDVFCHPSSYKK